MQLLQSAITQSSVKFYIQNPELIFAPILQAQPLEIQEGEEVPKIFFYKFTDDDTRECLCSKTAFQDKRVLIITHKGVFNRDGTEALLQDYKKHLAVLNALGIDKVYFLSVDPCTTVSAFHERYDGQNQIEGLADHLGEFAFACGLLTTEKHLPITAKVAALLFGKDGKLEWKAVEEPGSLHHHTKPQSVIGHLKSLNKVECASSSSSSSSSCSSSSPSSSSSSSSLPVKEIDLLPLSSTLKPQKIEPIQDAVVSESFAAMISRKAFQILAETVIQPFITSRIKERGYIPVSSFNNIVRAQPAEIKAGDELPDVLVYSFDEANRVVRKAIRKELQGKKVLLVMLKGIFQRDPFGRYLVHMYLAHLPSLEAVGVEKVCFLSVDRCSSMQAFHSLQDPEGKTMQLADSHFEFTFATGLLMREDHLGLASKQAALFFDRNAKLAWKAVEDDYDPTNILPAAVLEGITPIVNEKRVFSKYTNRE